ncbi:MAG: transcriptional regulator PpsR [Acetobacteraceae bacterium]|nr:transcriptional regulator PpsR [Acetobacteraceae bacterium]
MPTASFAEPDVTLHLDDHGVIRGASVSDGISDAGGVHAWVGRPWLETVSGGEDRVLSMLEDARRSGISAFRHVVQRFPSGRELPIEYTTLRVQGKQGGLLALGRSLHAIAELQSRLIAAQQATEREYWKLRDVETRYRLLFDVSSEAVLTVAGDSFQIVEANPAAMRSLGLAPGWAFPDSLAPKERRTFLEMLQRVREHGRAPGIVVHLGAALVPWAVRASLMATDAGVRYLLHLAPVGNQAPQTAAGPLPIDDLIERLPDGFVIVDAQGAIVHVNQAFVDLVQAGATGAVRGEKLGRWLSEPGADATVLLANVQRHQTVRLFRTTLTGELGSESPVEISAAGIGDGKLRFCGALVRDVGRRLPEPEQESSRFDQMIGAVTFELGRATLVQVVRSVTEAVERRMVNEALERTGGNRTAAAELLGLSRQSLHTKLNRYAMDGNDPSATDM